VAELQKSRETRFDLRPDAAALAAIRQALDLSDLRKLAFSGTLTPDGAADWELRGDLGATVVQPCVVTLAPVTTRIDTRVERRFTPHMPQIEASEVEMPVAETLDPLGPEIDLGAILIEALALALPDYPRAADADLGEAVFAEPGEKPLRDDDLKPFSGLAGLRDRLRGGDDETPDK
jgi:uncharacterized metal-binding protein YceD (DUF177 family)